MKLERDQLMARYWNHIAEDYQRNTHIHSQRFHYGPLLPGDEQLSLLPTTLEGITALEIGCGAGQNSLYLASRGANCTAFDIAVNQLDIGKQLAIEANLNVAFHEVDMDAAWRSCPGSYDFIHATYSLPFSQNPESVIKQVWDRLNPGGHFLLTMGHPLYAGEWLDVDDESGVFLPSYFTPLSDQRDVPDEEGSIGARCYPLSTQFNWLRNAGFTIQRMEEPQALDLETYTKDDMPYYSEDWLELHPILRQIPLVVIFLCQKPN